jgi:hypothetical protein
MAAHPIADVLWSSHRTVVKQGSVPVLHAVVRRKASTFLRSKGTRTPLEDIITSTVFGPLQFFAPADALEALTVAFDLPRPQWTPAACWFGFWPRGVDDSIEPDLSVRFEGGHGERVTLLVEVKWNAPFGEAQALRQWREFGFGMRQFQIYML